MKKLTRVITTLGILTVAGTAVYTFCLSDEAKRNLKSMVRSIKESYDKLSQTVSTIKGEHTEGEVYAHQKETEAEWEYLGY